MVDVEIEYCVPCGFVDPAIETQRALLEEFGQELDGVRLTTGHGGVFVISVDGETVWDKDEDGADVDVDAVAEAVDERLAAEA